MPFFRVKVDQNELQRAIGKLSAWETIHCFKFGELIVLELSKSKLVMLNRLGAIT